MSLFGIGGAIERGLSATFVCCASYAAHHGSPMHEFIVIHGAEVVEGFVGIGLVRLELIEQALYGRLGSA
jgi:hypothetical protein